MKILFAHANGFPGTSYKCLTQALADFDIDVIDRLGHGDKRVVDSWWPLVDELIEYTRQNHTQPLVGIGHSLGAILLWLAAGKEPQLFSRIIMLDPPLFRPTKRWVIHVAKKIGLMHRLPHPANKTKMRRTRFESHQQALTYFKQKSLFRYFKPKCIENYVNAGLKPTPEGDLELYFNREIEYAIFKHMPIAFDPINKKIPTTLIYATGHDAMDARDFAFTRYKYSYMNFIPFEGTHMFPFENPVELAEIIRNIIAPKGD